MQRNLVLILARDLADKLASAMFLVDEAGSLVYFNEAAAGILGQSYATAGHMSMEEWSKAFLPVDPEGGSLSPEDLPLVKALSDRVPAHRSFRIKGMDGTVREIAVTAVPLFSREDDFVGAVAIFWEPSAEGRGDGGS